MHGSTRVIRLASLTALAALLTTGALSAAEKKAVPPRGKPVSASLPSGKALDTRALAQHIDRLIDQRLREEKVPASPRADDAEFLRRAYLDITGRIPPADRVGPFLDDRRPDKRARLIDELLASPDYGKYQADIWQTLLLPRNSDNIRIMRMYPNMVRWLEEGFNANKPWDKMVRELLTASGETDKNGSVVYFLANPTPDKMTDSVTRRFLGVQLQCAQCHNHPFTDWKREEYWGMAAFFDKVRIGGNPRQAFRQGGTLNVHEGGRGRRPRRPVSAMTVPARFLQGEKANLRESAPYRPVLADWITRADNPYFSRAMVNRTWAQLFGRGLVNPVDDMHDGNPPSHPQLLADLSQQFSASGFDLKHLIRALCNSAAYQRTSKPFGKNKDVGPELFSRMAVKMVTPGQLFDSLSQALGAPDKPRPRRGRTPQQAAMIRRLGLTPRTLFVTFFGLADGADPTEYQAGIPQVLRLMNSPQLNNAAILNPLLKASKKPREVIEHLYAATLSRRPTSRELDRLVGYVGRADQPRQAYTDILWALLNSSEFTLNH